MPSYYYTKFQKNPCVGRNERCPLFIYYTYIIILLPCLHFQVGEICELHSVVRIAVHLIRDMEDAPNFLFVCLFQLGDLQSSYNAAKRAVDAFKEHVDSKELLKQLKHHFALL